MEVIDIHKANLKKLGYRDLEHWLEDENHVYIGRSSPYVKGANKSKWYNPFSVKKYGREGCLNLYRDYLLNNKELMSQLGELKGRVLGCWCYPNACHGDILVELIGEERFTVRLILLP